ncbi:hypothetical protein ACHAXT_001857 [Thalassiosira profunda]
MPTAVTPATATPPNPHNPDLLDRSCNRRTDASNAKMPKLANGILCFGPSTFVSCAFILSMFAQWQCNYVNVTDDLETGGFFSTPVKTLGIHCWQTEAGVNYKYGSDFDDTDMSTIQNLSYATIVMGGVAWCVYFLGACCTFPPPVWGLMGLVLAATAVTEGLVFQQVFNSDFCSEGCAWGTGAKCAISAMTFWALSTLMTCAMVKDAKDRAAKDDDGGEE